MNQSLTKLNEKLNSLSLNITQAKGVQERINTQCCNLKDKIDSNEVDIKNKKEAYLLLLSFISSRREVAIESFEAMGTYALQMIYDDDRRLVFLRNEEKKNSAAFKIELGIASDFMGEEKITGLKDSRGGGLMEVVSSPLRLAALEWKGYNGPFLADEIFGAVSLDKIDKIALFLKKYVETSKRQIIFATHAEVFMPYADRILTITQSEGISEVNYD